jgi:nucleotide-binding universal stress UspA family protein
MEKEKRRVLLVVDGSYQSFETVNYVSGVLPESQTEVVLLHITSRIPEAFWDLEKDPLWQQKVLTVRGWEQQQEKKINDFMGRARQVFLDAGFPPESVKIDVRERKIGIARDIGVESREGRYDATIIGRRGLSTLQDLTLGGVASKVVLKLTHTSVWLVGGRPETSSLLIGMDNSDGAMLAVDHVAKMTGGTARRIALVHVVRALSPGQEVNDQIFPDDYLKQRTEEASTQIEPVFRKAVEHLTAAGTPADRISTRVITGVASRAGAITEMARQEDFGTIVVGRRGVSTVEEFDMGRVSNKLIQTAKDRSVWIAG